VDPITVHSISDGDDWVKATPAPSRTIAAILHRPPAALLEEYAIYARRGECGHHMGCSCPGNQEG
jgi:hypothetical protein